MIKKKDTSMMNVRKSMAVATNGLSAFKGDYAFNVTSPTQMPETIHFNDEKSA